jgi:REP element-mobilizing transposase RayT
MSRTPRSDLDPGLYHLTARANRRDRLFRGERDRVMFCDLVAKVSRPETFLVRAHCLMTTHYHLLVETHTAELSDAMRDLNGIYAKWFNKEHGFRGHVFEERFNAEGVSDEPHLLEVVRYVALNPVRAGLVSMPARWRWGSFAAVMGGVPAPSFLDVSWTLRLFSDDDTEARRQLTSFVSFGSGASAA